MRSSAAPTDRPSGTNTRPVVPAPHVAWTGPPPRRQPATTGRAQQRTSCQLGLDANRIRAYRRHGCAPIAARSPPGVRQDMPGGLRLFTDPTTLPPQQPPGNPTAAPPSSPSLADHTPNILTSRGAQQHRRTRRPWRSCVLRRTDVSGFRHRSGQVGGAVCWGGHFRPGPDTGRREPVRPAHHPACGWLTSGRGVRSAEREYRANNRSGRWAVVCRER